MLARSEAGTGGGSEDGTGGAEGAREVTWDDYCRHEASYATTCLQSDYDLAQCRRNEACVRTVIRADLFAPYLACETEETCTQAADCFELPESQLSDAQRSYEQACRARTDCDVTGDDLDWDWCDDTDFAWRLFDDSLVTRMSPCFDEPSCGDADACLRGIIDGTLAPCQ